MVRAKEYHFEVRTKPYQVSPDEQEEMSQLFQTVMSELSFFARPAFLQRLLTTDILLLVRNNSFQLVAFGNAVYRRVANRPVIHIIAMYVSPDHRRRSLMTAAIARWLLRELLKSPALFLRKFVVTGSAVNPQVVYALSQRFRVWPDLITNKSPPLWVLDIAKESAERFYPMKTENPFQVQITEEFAGFRERGVELKTTYTEFDTRFFQYAVPRELKLLFFVTELSALGLLKAGVSSLFFRKRPQ